MILDESRWFWMILDESEWFWMIIKFFKINDFRWILQSPSTWGFTFSMWKTTLRLGILGPRLNWSRWVHTLTEREGRRGTLWEVVPTLSSTMNTDPMSLTKTKLRKMDAKETLLKERRSVLQMTRLWSSIQSWPCWGPCGLPSRMKLCCQAKTSLLTSQPTNLFFNSSSIHNWMAHRIFAMTFSLRRLSISCSLRSAFLSLLVGL